MKFYADAQRLGIVASLAIHASFLSLFFMLPAARMMPIKTFYISFEQQETSVKDTQTSINPANRARAVPVQNTNRQEIVPAQPQQQNETIESVTEQKPVMPTSQGTDIKGLKKIEAKGPVNTGSIVETRFGNTDAPAFIHREMPVYPTLARRLGKEGKVVLKLLIDMKGKLQDIEVIEAAGIGFMEAAVTAVRKSTFAPARCNGENVASKAILSIYFNLE